DFTMQTFVTYDAPRQHGAWYRVCGRRGTRPLVCGARALPHRSLECRVSSACLEPLGEEELVAGQRVCVRWRPAGADEDSFWEASVLSAAPRRAAPHEREQDGARVIGTTPVQRVVRVRWMHDSEDALVDVRHVCASLGSALIDEAWPR